MIRFETCFFPSLCWAIFSCINIEDPSVVVGLACGEESVIFYLVGEFGHVETGGPFKAISHHLELCVNYSYNLYKRYLFVSSLFCGLLPYSLVKCMSS